MEYLGTAIVVTVIGLMIWAGCYWVYKAFFGKCSYCGSKDIVPDDGLFFYCNNCRRKS